MSKVTWKKYVDEKGIEQIEKTDEDGRVSYVPNDPSNSDYQAFLNKDKPTKKIDEPTAQPE